MSYNYSLAQYFPNGIDVNLISGEINNDTTIQMHLIAAVIDQTNTYITFVFPSSLNTAQLAALNNIISTYVNPAPNSVRQVISSNLADSGAIEILATNTVGGIILQSGIGGITASTTNAFNVTSGAQSGISTTNGNLIFNSTNALTDIDGYSGINIGNNTNNGPINIGTVSTRNINIGNNVGSTAVDIVTGTGGYVVNTSNGIISLNATGVSSNFSVNTNSSGQNLTLALNGSTNSSIILSSQGTGPAAIYLNSMGGIELYSNSNPISLVSANNVGNAITLDTSSAGGGIIISSGSFGIGINSNGGALGIGHFSGGTMYIGTAAVARDIIVGTSTATFYQRSGNIVSSQIADTALPTTTSITLTMAQILTSVLYGTPTVITTITLPTLSAITSSLPDAIVNDVFDFSIINLGTLVAYIITSSGTNIGNMTVALGTSGSFRLRLTGTSGSAPTGYTVYRLS